MSRRRKAGRHAERQTSRQAHRHPGRQTQTDKKGNTRSDTRHHSVRTLNARHNQYSLRIFAAGTSFQRIGNKIEGKKGEQWLASPGHCCHDKLPLFIFFLLARKNLGERKSWTRWLFYG